MSVHGYTKNYKLIKPKFDADTWHDHEYDNLDTIDAVLSAIYASGNWQGFWQKNTNYNAGSVIIDKDTDTMYKVMVDHTTSEADFATEHANNPTYYELWSPNNLAESWATDTTGLVSSTDYSSKAYAISSGLIDDGSSKEWAVGTGTIGNTNLYSAKKYADDAHSDYISMTTDANVAAVGSNIASVNTVAGISSAVSTVANKATEVDTVAWISNDVTTVAGVATAVSNVSNIQAAVLNVSDDRANVNLVAQNINNVNNVGNDITNVNKVGNDITNVDTVATNISNVNTAAANMTAIQNATTAASNAANSATASANSASASANSAELSRQYANDKINQTHITNCITEIPQDIKLELNDGTLTLKAGSKVYVPNGFEEDGTTPKFDVVVIESDLTTQGASYSKPCFLTYKTDTGTLELPDISRVASGNTAPTSTYPLWYDTTTNHFKTTTNYSDWTTTNLSLPLATIALQTSTPYITSIDQIFNGFGYIGSEKFMLPNVKGLAVNGRNADGTLKNIEWTNSKVRTKTGGGTGLYHEIINATDWFSSKSYVESETEPSNPDSGDWWYKPSENKSYRYDGSSWINYAATLNGKSNPSSGVITSFTPKTSFQAVDRNDSSWLSGIGMPSERYIDLTLGGNGAGYTAPANGYFTVSKAATGAAQYVIINMFYDGGTVKRISNASYSPGSGYGCLAWLPVRKGDRVHISYTAQGETKCFMFVYAEGEN